MTHKMTDAVTLTSKIHTNDLGYIETNARTARTGVQTYWGAELGRPELGEVAVYRDESEVFSKASLATFSKLPITDDHPAGDVNATNWRDLAVGVTGDEVLRDGEYLKIGLKITDASAVQAVQDGKRELSVGYSAELVWGDGVAPDGTRYQARQTKIRANHVAIVDAGRAGHAARIGDGWRDMSKPNQKGGRMADLQTVVIGDKAVQVAATDAAALEQFKAAVVKDAAEKAAKNDTQVAKLEAQIEELKKQLEAAKAKELTDAQLDQRVADRAALVAVAAKLAPEVKTTGLSDAAIRSAVVAAKIGDAVNGKSEAYIDARFEILTEEASKGHPAANALADGLVVTHDDAKKMTDALAKASNDLNAWRNKGAQA